MKKMLMVFVSLAVLLVSSIALAQSQEICHSGIAGSVLDPATQRCVCPDIEHNGRTVHQTPVRQRVNVGSAAAPRIVYAVGCAFVAPARPRPRQPGQPNPPAPGPQPLNEAFVREQICIAEGVLCVRDAQGQPDIAATGRSVTQFVTETRNQLTSHQRALEELCRPFASQQPAPAVNGQPPSLADRCRAMRAQLDEFDRQLTSLAANDANQDQRIDALEQRWREISGEANSLIELIRNGSIQGHVGGDFTAMVPLRNATQTTICGMASVSLVAPIGGAPQHRFRFSGLFGGGSGGLGATMCASVTAGYQFRPIGSPVGFGVDLFGLGMWDPANPQSAYGNGTNRGWAFGLRLTLPISLGDRVSLVPYLGFGYGRSMGIDSQNRVDVGNGFVFTPGVNLEIRLTR
jgi:hypothetical protein